MDMTTIKLSNVELQFHKPIENLEDNNGTIYSINLKNQNPKICSIKVIRKTEKYKKYFSRGLKFLDLSYNLLVDLTELNLYTYLHRLNVSNNKIKLTGKILFVWKNLTYLNLSHNEIDSIPEKVFDKLENLKELFLDNNKLETINSTLFDNLKLLRVLSIANNQIATLEKNIFNQLINLEILYLNNNKLEKINESLFNQLIKLSYLNISSNGIFELEKKLFFHLYLLKILDISNNQIAKLNENMFESLSNLRELCLNVNQIKELEDSQFKSLDNLEILKLSWNKLTCLSEKVFEKLKKISVIHIDNNRLTELPFKKLSSLNNLNISDNRVCDLDENSFDTLNNLEVLNLSGNRLKNMHSSLFTKNNKLIDLSLARNQIENLNENLFESLVNLQNLDISNNRLFGLHEKLFQKLKNLKLINLTNNKLVFINSLLFKGLKLLEKIKIEINQIATFDKNTFNELSNLKILYLNNNKLEKLNSLLFSDLEKLTHLNLSDIRICELDEIFFAKFTNLLQLNIAYNKIGILPENLFNTLEKLDYLDVSNNKLTNLHEKLFFHLKELKKLYISNNLLTELPAKLFSELINLKWLNLTSNKITNLCNSDFVNLGNLSMLDVSNNFLKDIPIGLLDGLVSLEWLNLASNQIDDFPENSFNKIEKLRTLNISNNKLCALKASWFTNLKMLYSLDISCNNLSNIDLESLSSLKDLTTLNIFKNKLKEFNFNFVSLPKLIRLDLSSNQLVDISYGENIIEILKLNNNKIKSLDLTKFKVIQEVYLNGNDLISMTNLTNISNCLKCLHLYENAFNEQKIQEIESYFKNKIKDFKIRFLFSLAQIGYVNTIKNGCINELNEYQTDDFALIKTLYLRSYQFQDFIWNEIPMFAVITGVNGIGKTSLLKHIKQTLENSYKNGFTIIDSLIVPLMIQEHETNNEDSAFFDLIFQEDLLYNLNKYQGSQLIDPRIRFQYRNQASIYSFKSIESCLNYLKKDLKDLSLHLKKENFKYTEIIEELNSDYFLINQENHIKVNLIDLSPGEKLILLLLIWQFIFNNYQVYGKTVLLFDEPDAHLHPSAVHDLIKILKKLVHLGIQIIFTSHSPITVSFIDDANLFLLYEEKKQLKIRKGLTKNELSSALTSQLLTIEKPCKTLIVEGKDAEFYQEIRSILNNTQIYNIPFHYQINIVSLNDGLKNKSILKQTLKAVQSIQTFYGIVDDDGDSDCENIEYIWNLFYLKRYAKENYILDPVNVYFYLKNNPSKNDNVRKLMKKIQQKISEKYGKQYNDYNLNKIIEFIYLFNDRQCIKILELIIEEFYEFIKNEAIDFIVQKSTTAHRLFGLSDCFIENSSQKIANNFNKTLIVKKLYKNLLIKLKENKENLKDFKELIDRDLIDLLEKIKKVKNINNELIENYLNDRSLQSLCKNTFLNLKKLFNSIQNETQVNFDTSKICDQTVGSKKLIGKIKVKKGEKNTLSPKIYLKIKNLVDDIKQLTKYEEFESFDSNELNTNSRVEMKLKEERFIYINRNAIKYPNLFVSFNAHDLEPIFNNVFQIQCKQILEMNRSINGMIIPDELVDVFRNLCNSIVELREKDFKWFVFNTNKDWFIMFTDKKNEFDKNFLKALVLFFSFY